MKLGPAKQCTIKELLEELLNRAEGIPDELLIRQIQTAQLNNFNDLITTKPNQPPNLTSDIEYIPKLPQAMCRNTITFKHSKSPSTPILAIKIPEYLQQIMDNSFNITTREPITPLRSTKVVFTLFFPNDPIVATNAKRILNNTAMLINYTYSLLIKQQILKDLIDNPAARIPSITGYSMPHYSQEYVSQYDCFGSTITSQKKYTEKGV